MKKDDEIDLMITLRHKTKDIYSSEINVKRLCGILSKWSDNGLWEYGVSIRTGWLTDHANSMDIDKWRRQ